MKSSILKKIMIGFGGLLAVLILLVVYLAVTFNPNDYKSTVIQLVKDKKQRTLEIKGDIKLSFWPKIGADLGEISLSEHHARQQFAAIKSAKVALAILPLLKKEIVVDTVYLNGAQINIIQHADGSFNFDDLLSKEEDDPSQPINFDVQGIKITNTQASYINEGSGAKYGVEHLNVTTGQVALKTPFDIAADFHVTANQPQVNADAVIKANIMADPEAKHFVVKGLDAQIKGALLDGKDVVVTAQGAVDVDAAQAALSVTELKLAMQGDFNGITREVSLQAPAMAVNPKLISSEKVLLALKQQDAQGDLKLEVALAELKGNQQAAESKGITADVQVNAGTRKVEGHFASPVKANLADMVFDIPALAGQFHIQDPAVPKGAMDGEFKLALNANIKQEQVKTVFNLLLAETKLNGDVNVAGFKTPHIGFKIHADTLNLNALLGNTGSKKAEVTAQKTASGTSKTDKPADFSVLKTLFLDGSINIGKILYTPYTLTGLNVGIKADGQKLALQGLDVKLDDSRIQGNLAISQFSKPLYTFDVNIDKLDLNRYMPQQTANSSTASNEKTPEKSANANPEQPLDLSALKAFNAQGSIRIGQLKYGKTEAKNLNIGLKAQDGVASLNPLNVDVYQGTVRGAVKLDARATPAINIQQTLQNISVGSLLAETINNDMLSGTGNVSLDVAAQGATVTALKKSLSGTADLRMADGTVKGIDIAGTIRDAKSKLNVLKGQTTTATDNTKQTDFSELTASFNIKNGVARNDDLAMKAPIFRLTKGESKGDIDIGKEQINYLAKPTLVNSLKGQGGKEAGDLGSVGIPIKVTGAFAAPKFSIDMAALGQALAKSAALDALTNQLGGDKADAVKSLINGSNKTDALKGLLNKKSSSESTNTGTEKPSDANPTEEKPAEETKPADQLKQKALKKLLNF
ncbi:AsmA family protein [Methylophilus aquaticus]|uniref:AsmA family protein n=1 Tax=Methylophilus aquaticus TaxID=1971610 RepID=A0ABT9JTW2_9PROT|nr:AsmA family protein [Methylophilus aquaticus]MDP8567894.1 AsmA family protein [Methylophilus aquaticus]